MTASTPFTVAFSPIVATPCRVGEGEPPPSWDLVATPDFTQFRQQPEEVMMTGRGSPMLNLRKSKVGKKKPSPKVCVEKSRASWNPGLEKALVDLLHEHSTPEHRGQNGWTHESWNLMAKKFHEKHQYANLTKSEIQEKEKELKRDYRILKDARKQSGASWNDQQCMTVAEPAVWANIIISFPRAKKFRNKPFPLFDTLGELLDGNTVDGIHNFTSIEPSQITTSTEADTIDVEAITQRSCFPSFKRPRYMMMDKLV